MRLFKFILILLLLWVQPVLAGNPKPLFNKPVKLDQTGSPMYNSWERYEYQRKIRQRNTTSPTLNPKSQPGYTQVPQPVPTVPKNMDQGGIPLDNTIQNSNSVSPTPASVILNRPIQTTNDPGSQDFSF